ncbi:MAG: hypothetical protein ACM359_11885 [Bacillota bacterium]
MQRIVIQASLLLLAAVLSVGCQSSSSSPTPAARKAANTDPCAERLHEISGAFLLYYFKNHTLPKTLEDLRKVEPDLVSLPFICPLSEKPYVYNRDGLTIKDVSGRVIVYDPTPSHSGMRWAISIIEPTGTGPLITKVLAISESRFSSALTPGQSEQPNGQQ